MREEYMRKRMEKLMAKRRDTYDWIQSLVSALLICVLVFTFLLRMVGVVGSSMLDTLHNGDRLLVSNLFYTPQQGDIVVLRKESFDTEPIVKRVIALEGQTVDINFQTNTVYVDGEALDEAYIREPTRVALDFKGPVEVPEGCVFVLGDNRNGSNDSRDERIGCVDQRYIMGRAYFLAFPGPDTDSRKRNWSRIGVLS